MRAPICLPAAVVLLTTACAAQDAPAVALPEPAPVTVEVAAASSGGACRLLDFATIAKHTGDRFDVAAASDQDDTHTCVVRTATASWPELSLTVTDTPIDAAGFTADVRPDGSVAVPKLGRAGYRRVTAGTTKHGPVAEVGWLAQEERLGVLRWTGRPGAARAAADAQAGRLITLARTLDMDAR
ncbi:hypothetical protein ACFY3U_00115 [Micromonospora sp. NPDC000089]|uniref:hypothetical protein n=1 Tax=unclassified Micromonospora TaxID=2617518 RepID=UPI0036C713A8